MSLERNIKFHHLSQVLTKNPHMLHRPFTKTSSKTVDFDGEHFASFVKQFLSNIIFQICHCQILGLILMILYPKNLQLFPLTFTYLYLHRFSVCMFVHFPTYRDRSILTRRLDYGID